ncbi:MAG: Flp pilus assembly protein CpaB [Cyanobacteriota bacterium]
MTSSRRSKKKKSNKKLLIAIGLAAVLGILLLFLMKGQKGAVSEINQKMAEKESEVAALQEELKNLKENQRLQLRNQQLASKPTVEQKKNTLSVVVAKRAIGSGTRLSRTDLEIQEWPQEAVPLNAANYVESLLGRITSADVASGEPVLPDKLIDKDTKTLAIQDGYRAMTIPVDGITGVGGYLTPGARVDLVTVVPKGMGEDKSSDEKVSKVLMQNVKVLASTGKAEGSARGKKGEGDSATVTLAVPAEEAVKLALAYNNGGGTIQLILRGFQDGSGIEKTSIDTGELITGQIVVEEQEVVIPEMNLPPPPSQTAYSDGASTDLNSILSDVDGLPPPQPPTAKTKTHSIEIIQANTRQEVSFETEI